MKLSFILTRDQNKIYPLSNLGCYPENLASTKDNYLKCLNILRKSPDLDGATRFTMYYTIG